MNANDPNGVGFGAHAGLCGLGSFGHTTVFCKDKCGRRIQLGGFGGYCAACAPSHGIEPIKLGPEALIDSEPVQLLQLAAAPVTPKHR